MAAYYGVTRSQEYLAHHGILGMKWGKRNPKAKTLQKSKMKKWLKGLKEDAKTGVKAAGLSVFMGPYASMYMSNVKAVSDGKKKRRK